MISLSNRSRRSQRRVIVSSRESGAKPRRAPHPRDAGHVLGAGAQAGLLVAALQQALQWSAVPDVEGADAHGSVELVAGNRRVVDGQISKRHRQLAHRLGRVRVEGHPGFGAQPPDLLDRLHDARLAVDPLDGDQVGRPARAFRRSSGSTRPLRLTGRSTTSVPWRLHLSSAARTEECSIPVEMILLPGPEKPRITVLFASVAPLVKTMASGSQPTREARESRAVRNCSRPRSPAVWLLEGLPKAPRAFSTAARTSGRGGVVALLSR